MSEVTDQPETQAETEGPSWDEANDPDGVTRDELRAKDHVLDMLTDFLVGFDDEREGSFGVTVFSSGVVVSGLLIGQDEYNRLLIERLRSASGGEEIGAAVGTVLDRISQERKAKRKGRTEADLPNPARRFLHLKQAHLVGVDNVQEVGLWRGNLADVTGWSLGNFSRADA